MKTVKTKLVSNVYKRGASAPASLRPLILASARELFMSRGLVRVTADDIARDLGISKATLYKAFASKEEIIQAVFRGIMSETMAQAETFLHDEALGPIDKMAALFSLIGGRLSMFGPEILRDLRRGAPAVWKEVEDFRRDKILRNFGAILEFGSRDGLFREDIDLDLLLRMFISLIEEFVNPAALLRSGRSPAATFESVIKVFFQGILTDEGRREVSGRTRFLTGPNKEGAT
jgi:AcrR family transcriptional regulator